MDFEIVVGKKKHYDEVEVKDTHKESRIDLPERRSRGLKLGERR